MAGLAVTAHSAPASPGVERFYANNYLDRVLRGYEVNGEEESDPDEPTLLHEYKYVDSPLPATFLEAMATSNLSNSFPSLDSPISPNNRAPASPNVSHAGGQTNGNNGMANTANYMAPLPAGHQQDLNFLYAQIRELGELLKSNRDKVNIITRTAEEVARQANSTTAGGSGGNNNQNGNSEEGSGADAGRESDQARIRELEHDLAKANHMVSLYKHEQIQNTKLIAGYEDGMGTATEQIRNYCGEIETRYLAQRRHYNNLLQQEKDDHLASRLDRDHWHAQTMRVCEMLRTAHRLRCDEWGDEYTVIAGLQTEVRCLRRTLGMDEEKPEEEGGWPYLKDAPLSDRK